VPLVLVDRIVIDPMRRAKGYAAIGATGEHHISPIAGTGRYDTGHHINIIVSRHPGMVDRDERLST
jgi:hypothetical protein